MKKTQMQPDLAPRLNRGEKMLRQITTEPDAKAAEMQRLISLELAGTAKATPPHTMPHQQEVSRAGDIKMKTMSALKPDIDFSSLALRRLMGYAIWPDTQVLCCPGSKDLSPKNLEPGEKREPTATFFSKKLDRQVQYSTENEKLVFNLLEASKDVLWYVERPIRARYIIEKDTLYYVPDVLACFGEKLYAVIDVQPIEIMRQHFRNEKFSALRGYCAAIGWGLLLTDGKYACGELAEHTINKDFLYALRDRLPVSAIDLDQYQMIERACSASRKDLMAAIVQHDLKLTTRPFRLALGDRRAGDKCSSQPIYISGSGTKKQGILTS